MKMKLEIDYERLELALRETPEEVIREVAEAMDDIKDEWVTESVNVAPKDTGNLRRQIKGDVKARKNDAAITVTANAMNNGFNYGYYIHEVHIFGRNFQTPNAVEKFLEEPAEENITQWEREITAAIERALKAKGW